MNYLNNYLKTYYYIYIINNNHFFCIGARGLGVRLKFVWRKPRGFEPH